MVRLRLQSPHPSPLPIHDPMHYFYLYISPISLTPPLYLFCRRHLPQLARNPNVSLVGIVDASPHPSSSLAPLQSLEELATRYQCSVFPSVQKLLASVPCDGLDGVVVCTPHHTHYEGALLSRCIAIHSRGYIVVMLCTMYNT